MNAKTKRFLVETTGNVGNCTYSATDPDHAAQLARRHEAFIRLVVKHQTMPPEEAIAEATKLAEQNATLPGFKVKRIIEVAGKRRLQ